MPVLKIKGPSGDWLDIASAAPTGPTGPPGLQGEYGEDGATGPTGPPGDEITVGPTAPYGTDLWYDTLAPDPPPINSEPYLLKANVHAHHVWSSERTWTWTLAAGSYLSLFQHSAVATAGGVKALNITMDGVQINQSKLYFNTLNAHTTMNMGVTVVTIPTDGDYEFVVAGSIIDNNDFGTFVLIPATSGVVH